MCSVTCVLSRRHFPGLVLLTSICTDLKTSDQILVIIYTLGQQSRRPVISAEDGLCIGWTLRRYFMEPVQRSCSHHQNASECFCILLGNWLRTLESLVEFCLVGWSLLLWPYELTGTCSTCLPKTCLLLFCDISHSSDDIHSFAFPFLPWLAVSVGNVWCQNLESYMLLNWWCSCVVQSAAQSGRGEEEEALDQLVLTIRSSQWL